MAGDASGAGVQIIPQCQRHRKCAATQIPHEDQTLSGDSILTMVAFYTPLIEECVVFDVRQVRQPPPKANMQNITARPEVAEKGNFSSFLCELTTLHLRVPQ